ncbi:MAG TPA: C45 family autoproteolytic acyltransferase/hydrolase [Kofleriaceae bacterium]|nr:C45 family autoproteolytic acyltransferase/hydrolase [Kofleriaceae bacterium]
MTTPKPLWIARLSGTQEEMGRQHGQLLAAAGGADAVLDHYRDMPSRLVVGDMPPAVRAVISAAVRGVSEGLLVRLEADRPAELRARSRAFMRAMGRPAHWARYLGVMDLFQNLVGTAARWGVGPFAKPQLAVMNAAAHPACSTVMAWGGTTADGALLHARNFDFPGIDVWDAAPAVLLCVPDRGMRYGFVTTRGADTPVVTVWNEAGLVITSHTRFHRRVAFKGASIVDLVHEIGRRAETLADAERIARERPVSSTWGLAVSSARERRGISLEIHAGRVAVVQPAGPNEHLVVCNRYRNPSMQDGEVAATPAWPMHSDRRERRLAQLIAEVRGKGGARWRDLAAMLTDREDADAPGVARQLGGIVAQPCQVQSIVVAPDARTLWLGVGAAPVGEGRWMKVGWSWDGTSGAWELGAPVPAGIGITVDDDGGITRAPASDHVARAIGLEQLHHDTEQTAAELDRAIELAPRDPSLRLAQLWLELRRERWARAVDHASAGLAHETLPYRRAQLLLWGARAAMAAGDGDRAVSWRRELAALDANAHGVAYLQSYARRDETKPAAAFRRRPTANLTLLEAGYS